MAATDRHTRLVAWAKIALPLAALAILSTLFLASRPPEPGGNLPYGDLDPEALARQPRIGAPEYAGVTADGTAVSFTAETARPEGTPRERTGTTAATSDAGDATTGGAASAFPSPAMLAPGRIEAIAPQARLDLPDGVSLTVSAERGWLDQAGGLAQLDGAVQIDGSQGWSLRTAEVAADLGAGLLTAPRPLSGTAPFGTLEAGSMRLERRGADDHLLSFEGGVKLIYHPGNS